MRLGARLALDQPDGLAVRDIDGRQKFEALWHARRVASRPV
jgi:hypothetical protein